MGKDSSVCRLVGVILARVTPRVYCFYMETRKPLGTEAHEHDCVLLTSASSYPYSPPDVTANCAVEDLADELDANLAILRASVDFITC